jgi:glycerophosphoryl diester phosphodiesterase
LIDLFRRDGRPLVVGHRGAPALAPENTIASFETAVALGVDLVELDVLALRHGPLVVAHSHRLEEVTHGRALGHVGDRSLAELRELAPALATFDEALAWFATEGRGVGVLADLKLGARADEVAAAVERHGLAERVVATSVRTSVLRALARHGPHIRIGFTYPEDRLELSRRRHLRPAVRAALAALRASVPPRVPRLLNRAGATALMLQHTLVSRATVDKAHQSGAAVLAWTVDEPADVLRVVAAGIDGVITNDPPMLLATLGA